MAGRAPGRACAIWAPTTSWPTRSCQLQPWTQYLRQRLPDAPLWNPYQGGGRPFEANAQSALFSPFTCAGLTPAVLVLARPWRRRLRCSSPALGTFWLGAGARDGRGGRVPGRPRVRVRAVVRDLAVVAVGRASGRGCRGCCCCADRAYGGPSRAAGRGARARRRAAVLRRPPRVELPRAGRRGAVLPAAALARRSRRAPRRSGAWRLGLGAGLVLAAVALLPFARPPAPLGRPRTRRGQERQPVTVAFTYAARARAAGVLGPPDRRDLRAVRRRPRLVRRRAAAAARRHRPAARMGASGSRSRPRALVALLVATGVQPLFWIAHHLPGFSQSPTTTRLGVVVALCARAARRLGAGRPDPGPLARRPPPALLAAVLAAAVAVPVAAVALRAPAAGLGEALRVAWAFATPSGPEVLPRAALLIWLPLAIAGAALVWARATGRLAPAAFAAAAIALTAAASPARASATIPRSPLSTRSSPPRGRSAICSRALQALRGGRHDQRRPADPAQCRDRYRIADARAGDYPVEQRYATFWDARSNRATRWLHPGGRDGEGDAAGAAGAGAAGRDRRAPAARRAPASRAPRGLRGP